MYNFFQQMNNKKASVEWPAQLTQKKDPNCWTLCLDNI